MPIEIIMKSIIYFIFLKLNEKYFFVCLLNDMLKIFCMCGALIHVYKIILMIKIILMKNTQGYIKQKIK